MTQIIETHKKFDKKIYQSMTKNVRDVLIMVINLTLSILILLVFPERNFSEDWGLIVFIAVSSIFVAIFTYFIVKIIPDISVRVTLILHNFVLLNIVFASSVLDNANYSLIGIITYIVLSIIYPSIAKNIDKDNFHLSSFGLTHIALFTIWLIYDLDDIKVNYWDIIIIQLILAASIVVFASSALNWWVILSPLLFQSILAPSIVYTDVSWFLFEIFLIIFFIAAFRNPHPQLTRIVFILVGVTITIMSLTFTNLGDSQDSLLPLGDLEIVALQAILVYITFVIYTIFIELYRKFDDVYSFITPAVISFLTFLFVFWANVGSFWEDLEGKYVFLMLSILCFGVLSISILRYFNNSKQDLYSVIAQTIGMFSLLLLPSDELDPYQWLLDLSFMLFIISYLVIWRKYHENKEMLLITIGASGSLLILINLINNSSIPNEISWYTSVNYNVILFSVLALGMIPYFRSSINETKIVSSVQALNLFLLSFDSQLTGQRNWKIFGDVDILEIGLVLFMIQLIVIDYLNRDGNDSGYVSHFILSTLISAYIITNLGDLDISIPSPLILAILVIGSFVPLSLINEKEKLQYAIWYQGLVIAIFTRLNDQTESLFSNTDLTFSYISVIFYIFGICILINWFIHVEKDLILSNYVVIFTILILLFTIGSYLDDLVIPGYSGLGVFVILSTLPLLIDIKASIKNYLVFAQLISVLALARFKHIPSLDNIWEDRDISYYSIIYSVLGIKLLYLWLKDQNGLQSFSPFPYSILLLTGSLTTITLLVDDFILSSILLSVSTVVVIMIALLLKGYYDPNIHHIAGLNVFLLAILPGNFQYEITSKINLSAILYLVISLLIFGKQMIHSTANKDYQLPITIVGLTFALTVISSSNVPLELLGIGSALLIPILLKSPDSLTMKAGIAGKEILLITTLLLQQDLNKLVLREIEGYLIIPSLMYSVDVLLIVVLMIKSHEIESWNVILSSFTGITVFTSLSALNADVHPVIISFGMLSLIYPLFTVASSYLRELIPIVQGVSILFLLGRPLIFSFAMMDKLEVSLVSIAYLLWSIIIMIIWYFRGTTNQLYTSITSIFSLASIFSWVLLVDENAGKNKELNIEIILISSIFAIAVSVLFNAKLTETSNNYLMLTLISSLAASIFISNSVAEIKSGDIVILYRLMVDWLIYIPILAQVVLFLRHYLLQRLVTFGEEEVFDNNILYLLGGMMVTAWLIEPYGIYSLKFLVLAVSFWVVAITYNHKWLAWSASIFTAFVLSFILSQAGTEEADADDLVRYFIIIALIGVIMVVLSYINDTKYYGEPITASLSTTGSLLTFVAILAPMIYITLPFDGLFNEQLIDFLPNVVWAIQGLTLFVYSDRRSKEYLRRLALGILLVDILKTGYNIFTIENDLIRIVGAIVLGSILIYIFYMFTSETEKDKEK